MCFEVQLQVVADVVHDMIVLSAACLERREDVRLLVVDDLVCAKTLAEIDVRRRACRCDIATLGLCDLNAKYARTATTTVD